MSNQVLEIIFWDVKHGNAIYVKTPNATHIVQDLGTGSYGRGEEFSPLIYLKEKWKVKRLDYVIITHPHKDHIDDIMNFDTLSPRVLRRPKHIPEEDIMQNVREQDKHLFKKYLEINERYNDPVSPDENPRLPENNGGVDIKIFGPQLCSSSNINNHSSVAVLSYAKSKIILPGDNGPPSWKELLDKEDFREAIKEADILLAPHHGRKSGFYPELFSYFKPKLTIISDGRFCDSSATDRYSKSSSGWEIHHRNSGKDERRHCVTTRNDGVINVRMGLSSYGERPFIDVRID